MFNKPTVLIIGAGASAEFNMPLGTNLMGRVAAAVNYGADGRTNDRSLLQRLDERLGRDHARRLLECGPRLAAVVSQFVSMDEALHFLCAEPDIVELGKLAIAHEIMKAERNSHLLSALQGTEPGLTRCNDSWAAEFLKIALSASRRHEVSRLFDNVSVIDFNYDRVFPQFLYWALQHNLKISPTQAAECVQNLKIFHPYGCLGQLEWQSQTDFLPYGADHGNLAEIASRIRTYTEETLDPERSQILNAIVNAKVIILIGFGFHKQNIQILSAATGPSSGLRIFMTVYGIDHRNHDAIKIAIQNAFWSDPTAEIFDGVGRAILRDLALSIGLAVS